ncbi:hypothetical protein [Gallibacterium genomosp. 1]|uniref:hypothetical protein n=1 Tax=Gallibacterium genomosp. 1 TaxID=155515 RepID=UPI0008028220|nr:hypothetical protein [Gallibacterium genomosp. 1]OBX02215.1 hypothetical protein QV04_04070 [Gallibacterium genomosp. 1]
MSRSIELLVKMFDPRCVSAESIARGHSTLYKEQILAAFAQAEKAAFVGYHLLLLKYRFDQSSKDYLTKYIDLWLAEKGVKDDFAVKALNYVIDRLADIPLPTQYKRLNALRRRYLRSQYSFTKDIDIANQEAGPDKNSKEARELRINVIKEMRKSNICPRCHGTGEIGREQKRVCPSCEGKGRLIATNDHLIYSIGCSGEYFRCYLHALVVEFEQFAQIQMSEAESIIKQRLKAETVD